MRRAARADGNQPQIVAAFRGLGCSWLDLHRVGEGCPDGLAGADGVDQLVEIKTPGEHMNADQKEFAFSWRGREVALIYTVEDVVNCVKVMRAHAAVLSSRDQDD
jgi:hypothetical protein